MISASRRVYYRMQWELKYLTDHHLNPKGRAKMLDERIRNEQYMMKNLFERRSSSSAESSAESSQSIVFQRYDVRVVKGYQNFIKSTFSCDDKLGITMNQDGLPSSPNDLPTDVIFAPIYADLLECWSHVFKALIEISDDANHQYLYYSGLYYQITEMQKFFHEEYFPLFDQYLAKHSFALKDRLQPLYPDLEQPLPSDSECYEQYKSLEEKAKDIIESRQKMENLLKQMLSDWKAKETAFYQRLFQPLHFLLQQPYPFPPPAEILQQTSQNERIKAIHLIERLNDYSLKLYENLLSEQETVQSDNARIRQDLQAALHDCFKSENLIPEIILFGSRVNGLGGMTSDLDVGFRLYSLDHRTPYILVDNEDKDDYNPMKRLIYNKLRHRQPLLKINFLYNILRKLEVLSRFSRDSQQDNHNNHHQSLRRHFKFIAGVYLARRPILKLIHKRTNTPIDLGLFDLLIYQNTKFIQRYCESDKRIHQFLLMIKHWSSNRGLSQANGLISSYSWTLISIYFLHRFQQFFQHQFPGMSQNINNTHQRLRTIFVPEFHWSDHGRQIIQFAKRDLIRYLALPEDQLEKEIFELIHPKRDQPATSMIQLDNSITVGELFLWFFVFFGTSPGEGFHFDYLKDEVKLTNETREEWLKAAKEQWLQNEKNITLYDFSEFKHIEVVLPGSKIADQVEAPSPVKSAHNPIRMKIIDPLNGGSVSRTIQYSFHQEFLVNELRRIAVLLQNYLYSSEEKEELMEVVFAKQPFQPFTSKLCPYCKSVGHSHKSCPSRIPS